MVEPISLTVGTMIGVAGLYSVCMQAMEQIDTGRSLGKDSQKLLSMFEAEKYLFKEWGQKVGMKDKSKHHRCLDETSAEYPVVHILLQNLQVIWDDGDALTNKYGLEFPGLSVPSGVQRASASSQQKTSFRHKFVWACKDKKKFEQLLADVGGLIGKLYTVASLETDVGRSVVDEKLRDLKVFLEGDAIQRAKEVFQQQQFRGIMRGFIDSQTSRELLEWVGAVSTADVYDEAVRERQRNTCTWVFSNEKFLGLLVPHTPGVLWIHGGPGIGKTFLSASITEYLKKHFPRPTAYFFCTHEDSRKNQTVSILRSWIVQLATVSGKALEALQKLRTDDSEPVPTTLWNIFRAILSKVGSCHLVLDGFDECLDYDPTSRARREGTRKLFLEELFYSTQSTGAKILIISRNVDFIRSSLESVATFPTPFTVSEHAITMEDTAQDIRLVSRAITESKIKGSAQRNMIAHELSTRCQGMFLWARLAGEQLQPGMGTALLKTKLDSMPPGLHHAYKRDLIYISKLAKRDRDRAKDILRWALFAFEPLSVRELLHALEASENSGGNPQLGYISEIDNDTIQYEIIRLCGSFVEVRGRPNSFPGDRMVHFVHFSAKEFLLEAQEECEDPTLTPFFFPKPFDDHAKLTKSCLSYLLLGSRIPTDLDWFKKYSSIRWTEHFHQCTPEGKMESIGLQRLLLTPGPVFQDWIKECFMWGVRLGKQLKEYHFRSHTPLDATCQYGLYDLCNELLMGGKNCPNRALQIATYYGHQEIVRLLLAREDVGVSLYAALYTAAVRGHETIVQLFLEKHNILVNRQAGTYLETPLHGASRKGQQGIVGLLLARDDINVNAKRLDGKTPPDVATSEVAKLLRQSGGKRSSSLSETNSSTDSSSESGYSSGSDSCHPRRHRSATEAKQIKPQRLWKRSSSLSETNSSTDSSSEFGYSSGSDSCHPRRGLKRGKNGSSYAAKQIKSQRWGDVARFRQNLTEARVPPEDVGVWRTVATVYTWLINYLRKLSSRARERWFPPPAPLLGDSGDSGLIEYSSI